MDITCGSCATKLAIPEESLPKGVPMVMAKCPKCQHPIEIKIGAAAPPPAPAPASVPEPSPEPAAAPAPAPAPEPMEAVTEEFVEGQRLAMVCFDSAEMQAPVKTALEQLGYTVRIPAKPQEAVARLRSSRYEVLVLQQSYGGAGQVNPVLALIQPMAMSLRRHMCVGLVGEKLRTMDNLAAFALSVNFVVAEKEIDKIQAIVRHAVAENEVFYRLFKDALHEAGRV